MTEQQEQYTELEKEAQKWLDETDTMQFSQKELLTMFAAKQVKDYDLLQNVSTRLDFKQLRDAYFKEHVTHKTTDGIPMVCTHPHNLFEWFKAELKEYGC